MRVGINGMGRIGRLALRAALGGVHRPDGDPRAEQPARRRAPQRAQGRRRRDRAPARVRQHARPLARAVRRRGRAAPSGSTTSRSASAPRRRPATCLGRSRLRHRAGVHRQVPEAASSCNGYFDRGVKRVIVAAPVKDDSALNVVVGVNDQLYDPGAPPAADGGVLHHQLPRAGGQGDPRGDRHPARPDHHDPRSDQHQRRGRCAAQGSAARALGDAVAAADDDRQRHGHRADLSRTQGQAERPCRARAGAECQPHRLRVRAEARDDRGRGQRAVRGRGAGTAGRHPRLRDASAGLGRLLQRHAQLDRRRRRARWSPTARCSRSMPGTTTRSAMSAAWSISPTS